MVGMTLFRDYTAGTPSANDPLTTIGAVAGVVGWVVKREGIASSTAATTGQIVQAYKFATDNAQTSGGNGEGYLKVTIPLHPQGSFKVNSTLVA